VIGTGTAILNSLYARLEELEIGEQTELIILLIQHGSLEQQASAQSTLNLWLESATKDISPTDDNNSVQTLSAGLIVLVEADKQSSRFTDLVNAMMEHPATYVRQQLIPALVRQSKYVHWDSEHGAVKNLVKLLADPEENIRLAVIEELQEEVKTIPLKPIVWQALNDPDLSVRRQACKLPIRLKFAELQMLRGCLDGNAMQNAPYRTESAIYLLTQSGQRGMRTPLGKVAESLVQDTYWLTLQGFALKDLALTDNLPRPGARLMDNAFQDASHSVLERIFWLISADSSEEEVQAVQRALPSSDPAERANAAEALESILPPVVARQLCRLMDGSSRESIISCAETELGLHLPSLIQVIQNAWIQLNTQNTRPSIPHRLQNFYTDGWLTTTAIYLLTEIQLSDQKHLSLTPQTLHEALLHTVEVDTRPNVLEAAKLVLSRQDSNSKETAMSSSQSLTLIEKVIFLKEVPFFNDLSLQEICILAGISEEASYPAEHKIFSQGDNTKSLYLVVHGQVSVQQKTRTGSIVRLKTLGAKNYFAETSLFDGSPHQADIVTIEPVDILLIRQSMLFTLIRRRPDIGLSLLKALSQRLRETYAQVAQSERAKPQKLVSLYDKMER
jgi:CRP-like cAMP-binding protein